MFHGFELTCIPDLAFQYTHPIFSLNWECVVSFLWNTAAACPIRITTDIDQVRVGSWARPSGPAPSLWPHPSLRPRPASRPHPSLWPLNPCLDSRRLEGVLCSPPSALAHLPSWDENQDFPSAPQFPRPRPPSPSRCPSGLTGAPGHSATVGTEA